MRKLALPALAACALLAASAPVAIAKAPKAHAPTKLSVTIGNLSGSIKALKIGVKNLEDTNAGQTASINGVDARVTKVVADLTALGNTVTAVITTATAALTQLAAGVTSVAQATAAAAGTANPNTAGATTTATSSVPAVDLSTLSAGTTYRQFVLLSDSAAWPGFTADQQAASVAALSAAGLGPVPMGVRTWVRMPDVNSAGLGGDFYKNTWVCMNGRTTTQAFSLLFAQLTGSVGPGPAAAAATAVGTCQSVA